MWAIWAILLLFDVEISVFFLIRRLAVSVNKGLITVSKMDKCHLIKNLDVKQKFVIIINKITVSFTLKVLTGTMLRIL